ncbi:hypothetical protein Ocin01_08295 [Orchesella cincta]|uniref:Death domain-containing protein n=1 Tax=Orchesella cincta TaxID=48709 RepID=A0A1D2N0F4_ORCCI|nr:hypothetical protein Ocin01_08295 [Orchesella cincta]
MENNHALATLRSYIIEDLNYKHVGDYLVKQGLISQKEDFEIFQLLGKSRIVKLLNLICTRPGATRELVDAMGQPHLRNLYKDLIYKIENTSNPTSPVSPVTPKGGNKSFFNGNGLQKNILKIDVLKWKSFYEALNIDPVEMFSTTQKLLKGDIQPAEAYRDALDTWKEINGRKATFGTLDAVLRDHLQWQDAADEVSERYWD